MRLRDPHQRPWPFVVLVVALAAFGFFVAVLGLHAGGVWLWLAAAAFVGEGLIVYGMWIEPRRLTVARYREPLVAHPSTWVRIVFLSDFHTNGSSPSNRWERLVLEVQALAPDVVLLGGDYVSDLVDPIKELIPLSRLQASLGKYFVLGNHDHLDRPQDVRKTILGFGYQDLTHESVILRHEGREFEIHGVDDQWYGTIRTFERKSSTIPCIVLSHEPDAIMDVAEGQADLILSGHTHGGQVRFPFFGPLWIPAKLGRAVDLGRKRIGGVSLIVSAGLGQSIGRPRLFSPPQIIVVEVGI